MASEVRLPKLKENVDTVEVNEILVGPDDVVQKDQPLMIVNADKSNLEVYSPVAGRVVQLRVDVGDEIKVGDVFAVIDGEGDGAAKEAPKGKAVPAEEGSPEEKKAVRRVTEQQGEPERPPEPRPVGRPAGDGPGQPGPEAPAPAPRARPAPPPRPEPVAHGPTPRPAGGGGTPGGPPPGHLLQGGALASPGTRWLARKLGVDLRRVRGTGPRGRVTEEDVKAACSGPAPVVVAAGPGVQAPPLPKFEQFGPVERQLLTRVRRLTAQKMSVSWALIPHVTQHDEADITELEGFRKQQDGRGPKLTVTAFLLKACAVALKQFPTFNSTLDLAGGQLILKRYYHIGVAVDTKGGLLVPVIHDVDRKGVGELARELNEVSEKAREGEADMTGGTFTITNLGGIGGTSFTPIINYPEVAILGVSRARWQPVVREGQVVTRLMLPLSLSYDHRVIDGADAARFARRVAEMLENPWQMLL